MISVQAATEAGHREQDRIVRRLLLVSPSFPPKNTADMHRVRISLRHYSRFGWEPTVLCVDPAYCEGIDDWLLAKSLPHDVRIVPVRAWAVEVCRRLGFASLGY